MLQKKAIKAWVTLGILCAGLNSLSAQQPVAIHLKSGDRVTGAIITETADSLTLQTPFLGQIKIPASEVARREAVAAPTPAAPATQPTAPPAQPAPAATAPPAQPAPSPPPAVAANAPAPKKDTPVQPANPEAQPIAATPRLWQHRLDFGLNLRRTEKNLEEFLVLAKSTYAKQPFRHLFDVNFNYGRTDGQVTSHRLTGSEKTEYQFSKKQYVFNLVGAGYDEIRLIDAQWELGPGYGIELINSSKHKFVWKTEFGFNFQQQFRADDTRVSTYSARVAEIFAWKLGKSLTADAKIEFFQNLEMFGEYRLRLEATLTYPVTDRMSLNLILIDLYDTMPARNTPNNDFQLRSTLGIKF